MTDEPQEPKGSESSAVTGEANQADSEKTHLSESGSMNELSSSNPASESPPHATHADEDTGDPADSQVKEQPTSEAPSQGDSAAVLNLRKIVANIDKYLVKTLLDQADMEGLLINSLFVKSSQSYYRTRLEELNSLFKLNVDLKRRRDRIAQKISKLKDSQQIGS